MLTHGIRNIEWCCAYYAFSLGIVCAQAITARLKIFLALQITTPLRKSSWIIFFAVSDFFACCTKIFPCVNCAVVCKIQSLLADFELPSDLPIFHNGRLIKVCFLKVVFLRSLVQLIFPVIYTTMLIVLFYQTVVYVNGM